MVNICNSEQHVVLMRILDARNRPSITPDMPLWKLKLTEEEYTNLKETLVQNAYRLEDFGIEAALCYANCSCTNFLASSMFSSSVNSFCMAISKE